MKRRIEYYRSYWRYAFGGFSGKAWIIVIGLYAIWSSIFCLLEVFWIVRLITGFTIGILVTYIWITIKRYRYYKNYGKN
jgi:hypothetical protein